MILALTSLAIAVFAALLVTRLASPSGVNVPCDDQSHLVGPAGGKTKSESVVKLDFRRAESLDPVDYVDDEPDGESLLDRITRPLPQPSPFVVSVTHTAPADRLLTPDEVAKIEKEMTAKLQDEENLDSPALPDVYLLTTLGSSQSDSLTAAESTAYDYADAFGGHTSLGSLTTSVEERTSAQDRSFLSLNFLGSSDSDLSLSILPARDSANDFPSFGAFRLEASCPPGLDVHLEDVKPKDFTSEGGPFGGDINTTIHIGYDGLVEGVFFAWLIFVAIFLLAVNKACVKKHWLLGYGSLAVMAWVTYAFAAALDQIPPTSLGQLVPWLVLSLALMRTLRGRP